MSAVTTGEVLVKHDWYAASAEALIAGLWLAQEKRVALLHPSFVPNRDTQKVWTDVVASEISGPGYTAGGLVLANKAAVYDSANDRTDLKADDSVWGPGATFDAGYAVVYDTTGTKPLWSLVDFEGSKSVTDGTFLIDWQTIGLLYLIAIPS